jgi:hypothetical protein
MRRDETGDGADAPAVDGEVLHRERGVGAAAVGRGVDGQGGLLVRRGRYQP